MKTIPLNLRHQEAASTLVLVVFAVVVLGSLIGFAFEYTSSTAISSRRGQDLTAAQALANGALETAYKRWSVYMSNHQSYTLDTGSLPNYTNDTNFNGSTGFTDALASQINAAVAATGFTVTKLEIKAVTRADVPCTNHQQSSSNASIGPLANTPGWIASTYNYRARVVVQKVGDPSMTVLVARYFQQSDASLFQAMLFFQDDLELHPGPDMTLYGLVATNSNMYLAAGSGGSLTFTSNVAYHGNASTFSSTNALGVTTYGYNPANADYVKTDPNGYAEGTTARLYAQEPGNWGKGVYHDPVYEDSTTQTAVSRDSRLSNIDALNPLGIDMAQVLADNPNDPNATGLHEIIERPVPTSATNPDPSSAYVDPDAIKAHRLYNGAGLRVFVNHATLTTPAAISVYAPTSPNSPTSTLIPATADIAVAVTKAINADGVSGVFTDMREKRVITTDTVDMSVLTPALNTYASANKDYNGVLYITDATHADANGETGNSDAIRLKKGGILPDLGLTVVSDGAVYVQGDYNTGTTYNATKPDGPNNAVYLGTQPVSNTGSDPVNDPNHYTVSTYVQKPAAVIGDAVMILSNSWTDVNDSLALTDASRPKASASTFNAALVSGAVITTATAASGGAHNFPRFLEDWTSKAFTYHGSMCELYQSKHFTGVYGQANVYSPPARRWFFDNTFLTKTPPGNLRTTTYARGRWMRETSLN